jgi:hypothetical protein
VTPKQDKERERGLRQRKKSSKKMLFVICHAVAAQWLKSEHRRKPSEQTLPVELLEQRFDKSFKKI